jgi:hypothetical protein
MIIVSGALIGTTNIFTASASYRLRLAMAVVGFPVSVVIPVTVTVLGCY